MATTSAQGTGALDVNLARTAVEVVIPDEHAALVEIAARWPGVQRATQDLLHEVHHRYADRRRVLTDIHRRAMGDLHLLNAHERGAEALAVYCDLYATVAERATDATVRADGARLWLVYLEAIVTRSGERLARNLPVLRAAVSRLGGLLDAAPEVAAAVSPRLKKLAGALALQSAPPAGGALEDVLVLLSRSLEATYALWTAAPDPAAWYRRDRPPPAVERISHRALRERARDLERASAAAGWPRSRVDDLLSLPDNGQIVRGHLDAAAVFTERDDGPEGVLARIHWLLRVLAHPRLGAVQDAALRDVGRCCSRLLREQEGREGLVREVFALLRDGDLRRTRAFTDLVAQIGRDVMATGDPDLAAALVDEMLDLEMAYPAFSGYTSEWGVRVNPAHLRSIRAYLAVIQADPAAARRLVAALVAHLRLGGVFIADTDLFQRDVSALLASDIRPVYLQVKQLLRILPVYFEEIGAEGELRAASTRLDEIGGRRDPLCHLLRKQSHVECNPRLIPFVDEIVRFWATRDPAPLAGYVPETVVAELGEAGEGDRALRALVRSLADGAGGVEELLALGPEEVAERLRTHSGGDPVAREKLELIVRVRHELRRKYALDGSGVLERLRRFRSVEPAMARELGRALEDDEHERALELVLRVLEQLREIVLRAGPSEPVEQIYRKRHIAVGIPSMYGSYRETRLEAMGLALRLESLGVALLERVIADDPLGPLDGERMREIAGWLRLLLRALRTDGYRAQGLAHCVAMLGELVERPGVAWDQYLNVFQLISRSIESLIRARIIDVYEGPARRAVRQMVVRGVLPRAAGESLEEAVLKHVEALMRDLIAESFGLQRLDVLVGRVLRALAEQPGDAPVPAPDARPAAAPPQAIARIGDPPPRGHGIVSLGNKGFMLMRLAELGFPVPAGFIIGIEPAGADGATPLGPAAVGRIRMEVRRLERLTGARLGDPRRPLLLSVRGGAPISMPGMLESFLNVGINQGIAAGLAAIPGRAWAAWDAYRRFLQLWGMSHGVPRDLFDGLMREAKRGHAVEKKALLASGQMARLAGRYRELILAHGVDVVDEPFAQLLACIGRVRGSWSSAAARLYRRELKISDRWGTAVIVQAMVFGNLGARSGTGVMLTRPPAWESEAVEPYGDFVVQSQGDDVVSGLVETFPISERQRLAERPGVAVSLERSFPEIYGALADAARVLVDEQAMNHQEIEFTFEGDRRADLYVLQTRDTVVSSSAVLPAFTATPALEASRVATGIGVGGGALSGRVAHCLADVERLRARFPGEPVILLRRDTVPDDIPLLLGVDGLLTAVGGATSHAAVAAKRLGKTCVVGARPFDVEGREGPSRMGNRVVRTGDPLSINGMDGSVYLGTHPVTRVRVRGPAQR